MKKFSIAKVSKPVVPVFGGLDVDEDETESKQGPFDYMKARLDSEARKAKLDQLDEIILPEESEEVVHVPIVGQGPLGSKLGKPTHTPSAPSSVTKAGLVMIDPTKDPSVRGASKHIARMKETSQINDTFKNLLKVKIADREKLEAKEEFGSAPEEFVTEAYRKQKQASLELEKQLAEKESTKKDVSNLFREMLGSGSYSRTNFHQPENSNKKEKEANEVVASNTTEQVEVKMVLEKIVPQSTTEMTKIIGERAKLDAFKIIDQLTALDDNAEDNREAARERFLARKRAKLANVE